MVFSINSMESTSNGDVIIHPNRIGNLMPFLLIASFMIAADINVMWNYGFIAILQHEAVLNEQKRIGQKWYARRGALNGNIFPICQVCLGGPGRCLHLGGRSRHES